MRLLSGWSEKREMAGRAWNSRFTANAAIMVMGTVGGRCGGRGRAAFCPYISSNIGSSRTRGRLRPADACAHDVMPRGGFPGILGTH
jgi:hypothetical protein